MDEECSISLSPGINRLENRKRQRSPPRSSEKPGDEGPRKRRPKRGKYIAKAWFVGSILKFGLISMAYQFQQQSVSKEKDKGTTLSPLLLLDVHSVETPSHTVVPATDGCNLITFNSAREAIHAKDVSQKGSSVRNMMPTLVPKGALRFAAIEPKPPSSENMTQLIRSQLSSEQPNNDIAMALGKIQRQLNEILAHQESINVESESGDTRTFYDTSHSLKRPRRNRNSKRQFSPCSSTEVFSGESSITHVLHEMESHLEKLGMARSSLMSPPPSEPLTPIDDRDEAISSMDPIRSILDSHGIIPEKTQWDELLSTFIDEVYVLYPFLHLPALQNTYEEICDQLLGISTPADYNDMSHRVDVSQVLFCLAIGRCSESTRKDTENGHHSSGWSLFRASMKILGEPLEIFDVLSLALKAIQSMLLAVCLRCSLSS